MINLLYSNTGGKIFEDPRYLMLGARGLNFILPSREELIKLPPFAKIFFIPDSPAIGLNPEGIDHPSTFKDGSNPTRIGRPLSINPEGIVLPDTSQRKGLKVGPKKKTGRIESLGRGQNAVSVFLPPGYLRTLLPAIEFKKTKKFLPLWAYTAIGIKNKEFYACAIRIDKYEKWEPENYDDRKLLSNAKNLKKEFRNNPLFKQLFKCATIYHCFTAKNFFLGYPELAVPLSARCNASCIGCISLQRENKFPSSQQRITKSPSIRDVLGIIDYHIKNIEKPIISFGQGCEGEPLLEVELISKIIKTLKPSYKNATFNINTNGSLTKNLKSLIKAGLDTARVSINSAIKERYNLYFRPRGYSFNDVINSIKLLKDSGVYVTLNILVFPGITDEKDEIDELKKLIRDVKPNMLQLRNLNIDPRLYLKLIKPKEKSVGIINFLKTIKKTFPKLRVGSFNRSKNYFK